MVLHIQNIILNIMPDNQSAIKNIDSILEELRTSKSGLTRHEALKRLYEQGPNVIAAKKEVSVVVEFLSHFANPLILILLSAAGLSYLMGQVTDAVIIGCIILFGVLLDFFQEYSADKSLKKLIASVKTTATVIREGKREEVPVTDIVTGDIIFLSSGDMVPADARIIEAKDFFVNQSSITGESYPSEKTAIPAKPGTASISEMNNMVFRGTNVVSGRATAVVTKTGKNTEFGKIASNLALAQDKSDFEKGINNFGLFLMKIIFVLVIFIFFFNSFLKHDYFQSFMFAIAIAVGVTPELLPMIMSVTMTVGSKKMSKKGVIVKKLSSIPNFGSMNVLCTDKTGTLTENSIALVQYSDYSGKDSESVLTLAYINSSFQTGIKNTLDDAVIAYKKIDISSYQKVDEIPYDFFRKRMSVVVKKNDKLILVTKGAPEEIFKCTTHYLKAGKILDFDQKAREEALMTYDRLSEQGFRVLSVARREVESKEVYDKSDETEMVLEGFVSFLDPPKKDVREVINQLRELGVETKTITGDNELVTRKICNEVGLEIKGILLGSDLEKLTDDDLRVKARNITIFARCSP